MTTQGTGNYNGQLQLQTATATTNAFGVTTEGTEDTENCYSWSRTSGGRRYRNPSAPQTHFNAENAEVRGERQLQQPFIGLCRQTRVSGGIVGYSRTPEQKHLQLP